MEDFLKKVAFLGLGSITASKEKAEKGVERLVKKGEITAAQGERLLKKWLREADKTSKRLSQKIEEGVDAAMDKAGLVRGKDLAALERRIAKLEKKLAAFEKKTPRKKTAKSKTKGGKKAAKG